MCMPMGMHGGVSFVGGSMETKQGLLLDFMGATDTRFVVPEYQRAYSWETLQCEELWRDMMRAARAGRPHFVGMVLYRQDEGAAGEGRSRAARVKELEIVDGQQRLVTATLILLSLCKRMKAEGLSFFGLDAQALAESYLQGPGGGKLLLSRGDRAVLSALVDGADPSDLPAGRVVENHRFFEGLVNAEETDLELLWRGLRSLVVIGIRLGERDRAQAVFESLNSKGVPLTTADLVRNYLLMSESRREQTRLFEEYWEPMQGVFGDDPGSIKLDSAICAWLDVRCESMHWDGDHPPFFVFKIYCEEEYDGSLEDLLRELRGFATMWAENFRYHGVKKYKNYDWALNGPKTLVSGRPLVKCEDEELYRFYREHYGINPKTTW